MSLDTKKFAALISFLSAVTGKEFDYHGVDEIYNKIQSLMPEQPQHDRGSVQKMFDAMLNGRKIEAIKEHRLITGSYLKESKDAVESIMDRMARPPVPGSIGSILKY